MGIDVSEDKEPGAPEGIDRTDVEEEHFDDVEVRDLLRKAFERESSAEGPSVLRGVQDRLRAETSGQFFSDGWGTAPTPRETYLVTGVLILALLLVAWLALGPWGIRPL